MQPSTAGRSAPSQAKYGTGAKIHGRSALGTLGELAPLLQLKIFRDIKTGWFRSEVSRSGLHKLIDARFKGAEGALEKQKLFGLVLMFLFKQHQEASDEELGLALKEISAFLGEEHKELFTQLCTFMKNRFRGPFFDFVPKTLRLMIKEAFADARVKGRTSANILRRMVEADGRFDITELQGFLGRADLKTVDLTPTQLLKIQIDEVIYPSNGTVTTTSYTSSSGRLSVQISVPVQRASCQGAIDATLRRVEAHVKSQKTARICVGQTEFWEPPECCVRFTVTVDPRLRASKGFDIHPLLKHLLGIGRASDKTKISLQAGRDAPFAFISDGAFQLGLARGEVFVVSPASSGVEGALCGRFIAPPPPAARSKMVAAVAPPSAAAAAPSAAAADPLAAASSAAHSSAVPPPAMRRAGARSYLRYVPSSRPGCATWPPYAPPPPAPLRITYENGDGAPVVIEGVPVHVSGNGDCSISAVCGRTLTDTESRQVRTFLSQVYAGYQRRGALLECAYDAMVEIIRREQTNAAVRAIFAGAGSVDRYLGQHAVGSAAWQQAVIRLYTAVVSGGGRIWLSAMDVLILQNALGIADGGIFVNEGEAWARTFNHLSDVDKYFVGGAAMQVTDLEIPGCLSSLAKDFNLVVFDGFGHYSAFRRTPPRS